MFPRKPDQHKIGNPLIPNGLGIVYVLFITFNLFQLNQPLYISLVSLGSPRTANILTGIAGVVPPVKATATDAPT